MSSPLVGFTEVLVQGMTQVHGSEVQAGLTSPFLTAVSTRNNRAATWLQVPVRRKPHKSKISKVKQLGKDIGSKCYKYCDEKVKVKDEENNRIE